MHSVKCNLDIDGIREVRGSTQYEGHICFDIDGKYFFPDKGGTANPFYVLGWLLRELRLSYTANKKERHIYFNAAAGQYIFLKTNGNALTLKFSSLKEPETFIVSTIGIKPGSTVEREYECEFASLFLDVYDNAQRLYGKFKDTVPRGGCVDDLGIELRKAEKLARRLTKREVEK